MLSYKKSWLYIIVLALAACGGGGSSEAPSPPIEPPPPVQPPVSPEPPAKPGATLSREIPPSETDPNIDLRAGNHIVALPAQAEQRRGQLVLFYPGTRARPDQYRSFVTRAAQLGFHAISLDYENSQSINFDVCPGQPKDCYERARLEILTGAESPYIEPDVDQVNSAFNRLTQLLRHEHTLHPDEGWDAYFTASTPDPLRWDRIVFAGHSQGGGHAAMTAKLHAVPRVLLFGATEPAEWTGTAFATPPAYFWGLAHQKEPIYGGITHSWDNIGLPGADVAVSLQPPSPLSQRLATLAEGCSGDPATSGYYHNCYIVDGWMPPAAADGSPAFTPLWDAMLDGELSGSGIAQGDVVTLTPAGESWFDPEVLRFGKDYLMSWQEADGTIWLTKLDPRHGTVQAGTTQRMGDGAAPLIRTFNGPEFGVDAAGWALYYTKLVNGTPQAVRVDQLGKLDVLTTGEEHFSPHATQQMERLSTRLLMLRRPPEWGRLLWVDGDDTKVEHELSELALRTDGDARWVTGTAIFVTNAHPDNFGQISLLDTDSATLRQVTADTSVKTTPYAWIAPESRGRGMDDLFVLALVDATQLKVWAANEQGQWQERLSFNSPSVQHPYIGSPEPFVAGGRSYISMTVRDTPEQMPGVTDAQVWIMGIDPLQPYAQRCDDAQAGPVTRVDPEILSGAEQVFVYYYSMESSSAVVSRCATGLAP